uniref:Carnosine N-methyltransferase n=1 Tax=Cacopsylla melanoneura TaxID=428564 RepID=A0A8D8VEF9_9HEMI
MNPLDDEEEKKSFLRILAAFKYYKNYSLMKVKKNELYLESLPEKHQKLLTKYKDHLTDLKSCIDKNYEIIKLIIKDVGVMFENVPSSEPIKLISPLPNSTDLEKVQTTLKHFVRDWSEEGKEERRTCYEPIISEILARFPPDTVNPKENRILVPGAGLGRLAFEIARRGYVCQGNEFSLFMLFASNFILNKCREKNVYKIYPWVQQTDNNILTEHQTKSVSFPDINTSEYNDDCDFSMAAGDFLQVYVQPKQWNCVATCFFIDCANNIVSFIETIFNILTPGGIWINLGPLLYHYSNTPNEDSIEPSYEVVKQVIQGIGFIYEKEELDVATKYAQNPYSMLQYEYKSVFFVCRKPHEENHV